MPDWDLTAQGFRIFHSHFYTKCRRTRFIAENVNGKVQFIDPQTGDTDVERYFNGANKTYAIDNLKFADNVKKCCKKREPDD